MDSLLQKIEIIVHTKSVLHTLLQQNVINLYVHLFIQYHKAIWNTLFLLLLRMWWFLIESSEIELNFKIVVIEPIIMNIYFGPWLN